MRGAKVGARAGGALKGKTQPRTHPPPFTQWFTVLWAVCESSVTGLGTLCFTRAEVLPLCDA
jgi:hypothetical protein